MRIIAKAKPIRIRIKSGGEEHFSLDSLRQNLNVQDLWPLIKDNRLSRWLRQLGETELAHSVESLINEELDVHAYFYVLKLFLKERFDNSQIHDIYSLFGYWHDCEKRTPKNYDSLRKYLLSQYEGAKFIFKQYANEFSDGEWWDIFSKYENKEDPEFLFKQGKLAFEGFTKSDGSKSKNIILGIKLIDKAAELQNQEAVDFVNSNTFGTARKRAMLTPKVKEKIDNLICRWKNDKIGFITKKTAYDEDFVRDVKKLLQEFTSLWSTSVMHDWKATIAEAEAKYDDLDESDVFFKERKFVLDLVRYSYSKEIPGLFVKFAEDYHYPLAQYMIGNRLLNSMIGFTTLPIGGNPFNPFRSFHHPSNLIDGFCFIKAKFPEQLNFIVDHLFDY